MLAKPSGMGAFTNTTPSERLPMPLHRSHTLSWCTPFSKYDNTQALEHEGTRDATGTEVSEGAQERVMAEPQPHQAT